MAVVGTDNRQAVQGRRPSRRRLWVWLATLVLLAAAGAGGWFWWQQRQGAAAAQTTYETVSVTPAAYDLTISGPGTLEASQSVNVSTPVAGTIESLVSVGDTVEEGQTLVQIEADTLQEAVTEAELALEQAQTQLESLRSTQTESGTTLASDIAEAERAVTEAQRGVDSAQQELSIAQRLSEVGGESAVSVQTAQDAYDTAVATLANAQENLDTLAASQNLQGDANTQELRNAELAVEQAQLTLNRTQSDLEDATIVAPIAGVVTSINDENSGSDSTTTATRIQAGTTLSEGQTILTLSNYEAINLVAQVDETQISDIEVGQRAEVTAGAIEDRTFSGEVTAVSPSAEVQNNIPVFEVTVQIDNPDLTLRPGMTAEANITVETLETTLSVPTEAVRTFGGRSILELLQVGRVVPLPVEVVGTDGLNSVVQLTEASGPVDAQNATARGEASGAATDTGDNGEGAGDVTTTPGAYVDAGLDAVATSTLPDLSTLLSSGKAVTVRVPSTPTTVPSGTAGGNGGGFGGPPGGGFGGPPGGGFGRPPGAR